MDYPSGAALLGGLLLLAACSAPVEPAASRASSSKEQPGTSHPAGAQALVEEGLEWLKGAELGKAFEVLEAALARARQSGDLEGQARALMALARALREAHAQDRGLSRWEESLAVARAMPSVALEAEILTHRAGTQLALGQPLQARRDLAAAEEIHRTRRDTLGLARVASARSSLAVHTGAHEQAIRLGQEALPRLEQGEDLDAALVALSSIAYAHHQLGDLEGALDAYERVLVLAWRNHDQRLVNFAVCNRAEIRWLRGERRPALDDLRRAIAGFEKARERLPGTFDQRAEFLARQVEAYERLIRFLGDTGEGLEAFDVAERFHGRSLLELLDEETLVRLSWSPGKDERRSLLVDEIGAARLDLEGTSGAVEGSARDLRQRIMALEGNLETAAAQTWGRGRGFHRLASPVPATLEEVQSALLPDQALIAYWVAEDRIFAWVVDGEAAEVVQIPIPRKELEEVLGQYLKVLRSPALARDVALKEIEGEHLQQGRTLFRWLVGSLGPRATQARRWIVVPDGVLHTLPFEALVSGCEPGPATPEPVLYGSYRNCSYLGLEKAIRYVPSAGVLLALRERQRERRQDEQLAPLLALAPSFDASALTGDPWGDALRARGPLVFAREEAMRISALVPSAGSPLMGGAATEASFKSSAGRYRLLHLAAHGLVSDDLPMSSGLLLAPGGGDDGLLQAHEVLGLDLAADLVTLSGCRTGRGGLRRGEGIVGLSRSFLTAGASSVVVSLWDVDDRSTPLLMEELYRHLAAGALPDEALVAARRALFEASGTTTLIFQQRNVSYAHPRYWAPFILVGGG